MAVKSNLQPAAEPSSESLDRQLRAWFDGLLAQPIPEALLRHLDQLEASEGDQASSA
jgi:hypothetical protein